MTGPTMSDNLRGAAFMTVSMLAFAIEDVLIKTLSATLPAGQIVSAIGAGAALAFAAWFVFTRQPVFVPAHRNGKVWLRALFEVLGTMLFISALIRMPVTLLSAIIQATPLVVAMGGALFLGQKVGWRRWAAILVGFAGVLLIIRPTADGATLAVLLGVGGMFGLAGRDLATRAITVPISGAHLSLHAFLALIPAGAVLCWINGTPMIWPAPATWAALVLCVGVALLAYLSIVAATRAGDAAFISSFRYTRMVFALVLGVFILNEQPDAYTLIGVCIVIAAGVFTLLREAHQASRQRRTSKVSSQPL